MATGDKFGMIVNLDRQGYLYSTAQQQGNSHNMKKTNMQLNKIIKKIDKKNKNLFVITTSLTTDIYHSACLSVCLSLSSLNYH